MKILGISGSLRVGSRNTRLLDTIASIVPDDIDFEVASIDLPMFTDNHDEFPDGVKKLRDQVQKADALFFATPEYNWNMTTALKNAIDWISLGGKDAPLTGQVAAIAGIGGGRLGSVRAQMATRQTLLHNRVWVVPGPEVLIMPSDDLFNENGILNDEFAVTLLQQLIDELVRVTPLLRK